MLCAAKHDEGVYRLHALTGREHHQRIDVQFGQVSFKVHGEVRHAHQGILERLEVRLAVRESAVSNRAPLTSAIIACASGRMIGQRRSGVSLLP